MCSIGTGAVCRWMGGQATQADLRFVRDSSCRTRDESGTARSTGEVWQTQIKVWNEEPPELWRALYLRLWVKRRHCESEEAMTPILTERQTGNLYWQYMGWSIYQSGYAGRGY